MSKRMLLSVRIALVPVALFLLAMAQPAVSAPEDPICYRRIPLSSDVTKSFGISLGPDGNIWAFEQTTGNSYRLVRITPDLEFAEFPIPGTPIQMTPGPDGNIWYTRSDMGALTRVTVAGSATTFPLPPQNSKPSRIVVGSDSKLWVTETASHQILHVETDGTVLDHFAVSASDGYPSLIIRGPDNNLWFIEDTQKIGRMTTAGVLTEFSFPTAVLDLGTGPNGNIWYDRYNFFSFPYGPTVAYYGRITPSGTTTEFGIFARSYGMALGSDGNLWIFYASGRGSGPARFTPTGIYQPTSVVFYDFGSGPTDITAGADGRIWLSEELYDYSNYSSIGTVAFIDPQRPDCYHYNLPAVIK